MTFHLFLASLLAGGIGIGGLTAGEKPRPSGFADRCQKILDLQIAVHEGTRSLHKVIQDTPDKKPRPEDQQAALKLVASQEDIILEATKAIDMLEAEKVAVTLLEVFREVRKDMERVQRRLKMSDVGMDTQAVEQEIIDALKEMNSALKKR